MKFEAYLEDLRARQARVRPHGTPSDIVYPLGEISLPEHVAHWAQRYPDRAAIIFEERAVSYRELDDLSRRVAGWLESVGVSAGDRVAVYLPNCPQFIVVMLAVLRLGAVHVPVNPMFQRAELAYELEDTAAEVIVTLDTLLPRVESVRPESTLRTVLVTSATEMAAASGHPEVAEDAAVHLWTQAVAHEPADGPPADIDALAALNYTGGTTGMPKGCMHTQRHMVYTAATHAAATHWAADSGYVVLCFLPIFWIAGEMVGIVNPFVLGGTLVLLPRWDPAKVLRAIDAHRVTTLGGTVDNYLELLDQPELSSVDLSSLTDPMAVSFIRKLTPEVRHQWMAAAGNGSVLREANYGMTETNAFDTTPYGMAEDDRDLKADSVFCGLPVPGTDVAVVSWETGEPVELGQVGEIIVRGPSVMTGYWRKPHETANQLRDGWLHSGDNGKIDEDGGVHYLGRNKGMIKVKG